jgi:hypothetical protein
VSVHWDGYPAGVGEVLERDYGEYHADANREKVEALLEGGDLCYLESDTCLEHFPVTDSTMTKEDTSYSAFFYRTLDHAGEYYYLYEHGVGWKCGSTLSDNPLTGRLVSLSEAIEAIEEWEEAQRQELGHEADNELDV